MREIGVFLIFSGVIVLIGWLFDISILKSIVNGHVTMKVKTALSFVLLGIEMVFLKSRDERGHIAGMSAALALLTLTLWHTLTAYINGAGIAGQLDIPIETVVPGLNSLGTITVFCSLGLGGIGYLVWNKLWPIRLSAWLSLAAGVTALAGHALDIPALYFYVDGFSTGMAIHTSALFMLAGGALLRLR